MDNLPVRIETERLIVQTPLPSFTEKILSYLITNREFFQPWLPLGTADFYTLNGQQDILEEDLLLMKQGLQTRFYLFKKDDEKIVGDFTFGNIARGVLQSCFLGYKLSQKENGKGYMAEALHAGIDYAFDQLMLHRIEANIIPRNKRSIALIENLGFRNEGLSREYLKINGVWEDHHRYAKLNIKLKQTLN
jgi:ribosomal-protein-alanine N-acetyltransferase